MRRGKELSSEQIWSLFEQEYLEQNGAYVYGGHQLSPVREQPERRATDAETEM